MTTAVNCTIIRLWYRRGGEGEQISSYYAMPHEEVTEFIEGCDLKHSGSGVEIVSNCALSTM